MAKHQKKSLQTYILEKTKDKYIAICNARGVSASEEIRNFINKEVKKHSKLIGE